uniref:Potassium transporter n=1 Tax=Tanacetum cinerariifolium TaxID=118510 RepID=A0A6L2MZ56_TANCI|nr:potassium transporter [Tanacetum cinerariifolium]
MNEDRVSFGVPPQRKGEVQILSQLDMLRDANEVVYERSHSSLLKKRQADMCIEDDVEFPIFVNNDEFTFTPEKASAYNSDEEIISDDERL